MRICITTFSKCMYHCRRGGNFVLSSILSTEIWNPVKIKPQLCFHFIETLMAFPMLYIYAGNMTYAPLVHSKKSKEFSCPYQMSIFQPYMNPIWAFWNKHLNWIIELIDSQHLLKLTLINCSSRQHYLFPTTYLIPYYF